MVMRWRKRFALTVISWIIDEFSPFCNLSCVVEFSLKNSKILKLNHTFFFFSAGKIKRLQKRQWHKLGLYTRWVPQSCLLPFYDFHSVLSLAFIIRFFFFTSLDLRVLLDFPIFFRKLLSCAFLNQFNTYCGALMRSKFSHSWRNEDKKETVIDLIRPLTHVLLRKRLLLTFYHCCVPSECDAVYGAVKYLKKSFDLICRKHPLNNFAS